MNPKSKKHRILKVLISVILASLLFMIIDRVFNLELKIKHLDNYILILENFRLVINSSIKQQDESITVGNFQLRGSKLTLTDSNSGFDFKLHYLYFEKDTYEKNFLGLSPFDRCTLKSLLIEILKNSREHPKALVLDFDLSPIGYSYEDFQGQKFLRRVSKHYEKCENELFQFIYSLAEKGILIVLVKTENGNLERLFEEKYNSRNIKFASSDLNQLYGVTYYYEACVSVDEISNTSNTSNKSLINLSFCPENHIPTIGGMLFSELICRFHKFEDYKDLRFFFEHGRIEKFEKNDIDNNSIVFIGSTIGDLHEAIFSEESVPGVKVHAFGFMSLLRHYEIKNKKDLCRIIFNYIISFIEELLSFLYGYLAIKLSFFILKFPSKLKSIRNYLLSKYQNRFPLFLFMKIIKIMKKLIKNVLENLSAMPRLLKKLIFYPLNLITIVINLLISSKILREAFTIAIQIFIVISLMLIIAGVYRYSVFEIARTNLIDFRVSFIFYGLIYSLLEKLYERLVEQDNAKIVIN